MNKASERVTTCGFWKKEENCAMDIITNMESKIAGMLLAANMKKSIQKYCGRSEEQQIFIN